MEVSSEQMSRPVSLISWSSVIAGSIVATAFASVLHGFGAAIGLATSSSSPTWRDASVGLFVLTGVYLILVALASYGLGGYITGWLRSKRISADDDEVTTSNVHGLLVWAFATLLTLIIVATAVSIATRSSGSSGTAVSSTSEALIAYDLDRLLRGDARGQAPDYGRIRGEAGRILMAAGGREGVSPDDRSYLIRLVNAQTNLTPADSERRVDASFARARESISRARRSGVVLGFMASSAILLGLLAAWYATPVGNRHRIDRDLTPVWGGRASVSRFP